MIAYKFLRAGRTGPFSGFVWPQPGIWVRPGRETVPCRQGVHACRTQDLPWWLADELWVVELEGSITVDDHKLVATDGRLRSRIDRWTVSCAQQYAAACAWRTRDRAAQALRRADHERAAAELESCPTLDDLFATARRLTTDIPDTRISLTIAGDGASRALTGAPPTSAYIAANAALRLDGAAGYDAERAWQAGWLAERLELDG